MDPLQSLSHYISSIYLFLFTICEILKDRNCIKHFCNLQPQEPCLVSIKCSGKVNWIHTAWWFGNLSWLLISSVTLSRLLPLWVSVFLFLKMEKIFYMDLEKSAYKIYGLAHKILFPLLFFFLFVNESQQKQSRWRFLLPKINWFSKKLFQIVMNISTLKE